MGGLRKPDILCGQALATGADSMPVVWPAHPSAPAAARPHSSRCLHCARSAATSSMAILAARRGIQLPAGQPDLLESSLPLLLRQSLLPAWPLLCTALHSSASRAALLHLHQAAG